MMKVGDTMIDSRKIEDLHPALQRGFQEFKIRMKKKSYDAVLVTNTYRSIGYQNYLYEQGRSRPGKIITNARGGNSYHNYGLAFDICKNIKGQEYNDPEFFKTAGRIWEEMGGEWGGHFKTFTDMPHFQFRGNLTISDLKKGLRLDDEVLMLWEQYRKSPEIVEYLSFLLNKQKKEIERIFVHDLNFVLLKEIISMLDMSIGYDSTLKVPTIKTKYPHVATPFPDSFFILSSEQKKACKLLGIQAEKGKINVNGQMIDILRILYKDVNFVSLAMICLAVGVDISYNIQTRLPEIITPNNKIS